MRYLVLLLTLASCAAEQPTLTTPQRLFAQATDTTALAGPLPAGGKYKFHGPVTITYQLGNGNVATPTVKGTDKTGQRAQAVSTGPDSPVTASQKKSGVPWWVFLLIAVVGAVVWQYVSHRLKLLNCLSLQEKPRTG